MIPLAFPAPGQTVEIYGSACYSDSQAGFYAFLLDEPREQPLKTLDIFKVDGDYYLYEPAGRQKREVKLRWATGIVTTAQSRPRPHYTAAEANADLF